MLSLMWVLDPANSRELLDRLRPHSLSSDFEIVWCGEGWRTLINDCHNELAAAFPDYRFYTIKQKWGVLTFQARPRAGDATSEELAAVDEVTARFATASEVICEWCGLRSTAPEWQTLCDSCAEEMKTRRYPSSRPIA